ncbi:hypothetical protein C9374_012359 [Naegleria lovaniensis]|uniref:Autophagy-related protein 27 n=1 Tax=Naegleria lovaniensis TaxID=51637 RepID=A0AA88GB57_NAELO|nr:uncharacterized protein C9374_012359 [Naegleria lovaniensis]KAG2373256.1 hypothetical protein C9374_012359 [Naegleria lovaniensis]
MKQHQRFLLATLMCCLMSCLMIVSRIEAACTYSTTNGKTIDVSGADKQGGYTVTGQGWDYYFNVCELPVTAPSGKCSFTPTPQAYQYSASWNDCYPIGNKGSPKIVPLVPTDETQGVKITHEAYTYQSARRELVIKLKCDATATTTTFTFEGEATGAISTYTFSGSSKYACVGAGPGPTPGGDEPILGQYGIGGLLLTLLLVGFILYFIIGALVLKFAMKKSGTEIIPQFGFWKDLPFLLLDGIMLPVDLIKGCMGKNKYQEMA